MKSGKLDASQNSTIGTHLTLKPALKALLEQEIQQQLLPDHFLQTVEQWLLPVANHLQSLHREKGEMLIVSFNGSQGSGKSTQTRFLSLLLKGQYGLNTIDVSIDDFYLTKAERQTLSEQVHPLFITRGVPGTHDVDLACTTLQQLRSASSDQPCALPRFNKAIDDRADRAEWTTIGEPVDIVLFEGWCNHAPVQSDVQLIPPINDLEKNEDADLRWRSHVNSQIALYHERLFSQADALIYLQIPYFEIVYEWRGLQEQKLAAKSGDSGKAVMDDKALRRFIQHYERITRACLAKLPSAAQVVIELDKDHRIKAIKFNETSVSIV